MRCTNHEAHDPHWHTIRADKVAVAGGMCNGEQVGSLHGDGCVDCRNGVTEWHRSRTDKPNPVRKP